MLAWVWVGNPSRWRSVVGMQVSAWDVTRTLVRVSPLGRGVGLGLRLEDLRTHEEILTIFERWRAVDFLAVSGLRYCYYIWFMRPSRNGFELLYFSLHGGFMRRASPLEDLNTVGSR